MNTQQIIKQLKAVPDLVGECPNCNGEFPVAQAVLFDPSGGLPEEAQAFLERRKEELREGEERLRVARKELREKKHSATDGAEQKAMETTLGLVVEKIVTGWEGFPHAAQDCRPLYEPIDYIAFDGLSSTGTIERIAFIDIKTGAARLNKHQRKIRNAIRAGRVDYREI